MKRFDGANWTDVELEKRFDGANWVDIELKKRFDGANWIDVWNATPAFTLSQEVNIQPIGNEPKYKLLSKNRLEIQIAGAYNAKSDEHYVEFKCNNMVIPAGVSSVYNYTLTSTGYMTILIGIGGAASGSKTYNCSNHECTSSGNSVSVPITNNRGCDCVPVFKMETKASIGKHAIVQLNSIVVNGKTYNPIFKL